MAPRQGSTSRSTPLSVYLIDYDGKHTRHGAGLRSLLAAANGEMEFSAAFACAPNISISATISLDSTPDDRTNKLYVDMTAPPLSAVDGCEQGVPAHVRFYLDGDPITFEGTSGSQLSYTWLGAFIQTISPNAGVTSPGSGGVQLTVVIQDLLIDLDAVLNVTLGGEACRDVSVDLSQMVADHIVTITLRTPILNITGEMETVNLTVWSNGTSLVQATWTSLAPPAPFIVPSLTLVNGDPAPVTAWIFSDNITDTIATIRVSVLDLTVVSLGGQMYDALVLLIDGSQEVAGVVVASGAGITSVEFEIPGNMLPIGTRLLAFDARKGGASLLAFPLEALSLVVKDGHVASAVQWAPMHAPSRGGAYLLVAVTNAPANFTMESVTFLFDNNESALAELAAAIPLQDWLAETAAFISALEDTSFAEFRALTSTAMAADYTSVVASLESAHASMGLILVVKLPGDPGVNASSALANFSGLASVNGLESVNDVVVSLVASVFGPATVEFASTDAGDRTSGLGGGGAFRIVLSGFSIVNSKSEILVTFGGEVVPVVDLLSSTESSTEFSILIPAGGAAGTVSVSMRPTFQASNFAELEFEYQDLSLPLVTSFAPDRCGARNPKT